MNRAKKWGLFGLIFGVIGSIFMIGTARDSDEILTQIIVMPFAAFLYGAIAATMGLIADKIWPPSAPMPPPSSSTIFQDASDVEDNLAGRDIPPPFEFIKSPDYLFSEEELGHYDYNKLVKFYEVLQSENRSELEEVSVAIRNKIGRPSDETDHFKFLAAYYKQLHSFLKKKQAH